MARRSQETEAHFQYGGHLLTTQLVDVLACDTQTADQNITYISPTSLIKPVDMSCIRFCKSTTVQTNRFVYKYCIVLYCIVLYCIVLYCIVLYCIVLYRIVFDILQINVAYITMYQILSKRITLSAFSPYKKIGWKLTLSNLCMN